MGVVLITGCSSGFGLEAALAFARRGDTAVATMRDPAKAETLRKRAADEGVEVHVVALDVTDDASVTRAVTTVRATHGPIDVVVNNAGVGYGGPVETIPIDAARELMETNFWGALRIIRAVLPDMRAQRAGVIVNISSLSGRLPGALYSGLYAVSKHALGTLSEALAGEVAPFGIRVVCIEPGFFATAISANSDAVDQGTGGTAYEADAAWFNTFMDTGVASGAHPSVVAEAIVAAVEDPATPLHVPVGDDTALYLGLWEQTGTFESWMEAAVPVVEQIAGPRPPVTNVG